MDRGVALAVSFVLVWMNRVQAGRSIRQTGFGKPVMIVHHVGTVSSRLAMRTLFLPFTLLLLVLACATEAATAYQVADLNTTATRPSSSYVAFLGATSSRAFFVDDLHNILRATDGTAAGTVALLPTGTAIGPYTVTDDNAMYFAAGPWKLWKSDGTVAGTLPLTSSLTSEPVPLGSLPAGVLYESNSQRELSIHTPAGETLLATIRSSSSTPPADGESYASWRGALYLGTGEGLWKTDGTAAGTIRLSPNGAYNVTAGPNGVYFASGTIDTGSELWFTDGTAAGTRLVTELHPGSTATFRSGRSGIAPSSHGVVFLGLTDLGVSDGTAAGTHVIRTFAPAAHSPVMASGAGAAWFAFDDGEHGIELWRSDGTVAGTTMVKDLFSGTSSIPWIAAGATRVYFTASDESHTADLYESDGTDAGTHLVHPSHPAGWISMYPFDTIGDTVMFPAFDPATGTEPWITDGTDAGTRIIANLSPETGPSSNPHGFVAGERHVYFTAFGNDGDATWRSDGTAAATTVVSPLQTPRTVAMLAEIGDTEYYARGLQLIARTAGVETVLRQLSSSFVVGTPVPFNGRLYLSADGIWTTDGTVAGTVRAGDSGTLVRSGATLYAVSKETIRVVDGTTDRVVASGLSNITSFAPFGGGLIVFSSDPKVVPVQTTLTFYPGSAADAVAVATVPGNVSPKEIAGSGTSLFFTAGAASELSLWKTDGTPAGTARVASLPLTFVSEMRSLGARLAMIVGDELWVSDGTAAGTQKVTINAAGSAQARQLTVVDGIAYLLANDGVHVPGAWQTDGTAAGTHYAADLSTLFASSVPPFGAQVGDRFYYPGFTLATGMELWALALDAPAVTVDDARTSESAGHADVTVRLTHAASRSITVSWSTADATAKAGRDYTTGSGTVTFAPGETTKTISVTIARDPASSPRRFLWVTLSSADAAVARTAAAVAIDDADVSADVSVSIVRDVDGVSQIVVRNAGTSGASAVTLCHYQPGPNPETCETPFALAAGAVFTEQLYLTTTGFVTARVTHAEADPNRGNDSTSADVVDEPFLHMLAAPATPQVGQSGIVTIWKSASEPAIAITSSDPATVTVDAIVFAAGSNIGTAAFHAMREGSATLTAKFVTGSVAGTLPIRVQAAGTNRTPTTMRFTHTPFIFGSPALVTVNIIAPGAANPTGTVTLHEGATQLASAPVVNGSASLILNDSPLGDHTRVLAYSGDANYLESSVDMLWRTSGAAARFSAEVSPDGTAHIIAVGLAGHPPSGTISVLQKGAQRHVAGPLVATGPATSQTEVDGLTREAGAMMTINYSGDSVYVPFSVIIPVGPPRPHAARH
jgi:ELWxxDGT repeat protein